MFSSPGAEQAPSILVELENVTRAYRTGASEIRALDGVSFRVAEGAMLGIVGPSGSGKSTLLAILGCLDRPTSGRHFFHGTDTTLLDDDRLSDIRLFEIGFVFQGFNLIASLDVLENIALPLEYKELDSPTIDEKARAAAERVGLGQRLKHRPGELSGGEQQRVALARALAGAPKLLLADEPTGNLDTRTGREIMELIAGLNRDGVTVVMVTHNLSLHGYFHSIIEVRDGRLEG